jgi:hypothetical protein
MAYEKEFFHLRWREKKREKLQGGASAGRRVSRQQATGVGFLLCKLRSVLIKSPEFIYGDAFLAAEF